MAGRKKKRSCAACSIALTTDAHMCELCSQHPLAIKGVCGWCGTWLHDQSIESYVARGNCCKACDEKMERAVDSESKIDFVLRNFTF